MRLSFHTRYRLLAAVLALLALVMAAFPASAQEEVPDSHSDTNAIVVQAFLCPTDYRDNNFVADCPGEADIDVTVIRDADGFSVSDVTGADGVIGFQGLGEGTYTIELGVPGDVADFMTFCGTPEDTEPREVTNPDTNRIGVYAGPTEQLTCSFYIVPVDAAGEPTSPAPVTDLPSTGDGGAGVGQSGLPAPLVMIGASVLTGLGGTWMLRRRV